MEFVKDLKAGSRSMRINSEDAQSGMGSEEGAGKGWCVSLLFKKCIKMRISVFSAKT